MVNKSDSIMRWLGKFHLYDEEISGELSYENDTGCIVLVLSKKLDESEFFGKRYSSIEIIRGESAIGQKITLINNKCIHNETRFPQSQVIAFSSELVLFSNNYTDDTLFNEYSCTLINAFEWSGLKVFEVDENGLRLNKRQNKKEYRWFGATVEFSVFANECFIGNFDYEEKNICQRVKLSIKTAKKKPIDYFIGVKDKVTSLISFAMANNVNVENGCLRDYDNYYSLGNQVKQYYENYIIEARRELDIYKSNRFDYKFLLDQLNDNERLSEALEKLVPVFNLYQSLFRYRDMPIEMVF